MDVRDVLALGSFQLGVSTVDESNRASDHRTEGWSKEDELSR